jgi:hypothetical protein
MKQGIISAEQGILAQKQENFTRQDLIAGDTAPTRGTANAKKK